MTHRSDSLFVPLVQTLLISASGFLLVRLLAQGSTRSGGGLLIGSAAIALMFLGLQLTERSLTKS